MSIIGTYIAIGGSDPRGTNTVERYQNALISYDNQSFGIYWEVFRDLEIREARHDNFIEKDLFNLIDSSKKIVDDFKMLIKERYRPEWTKAINEDDIIGIVKLIIRCHISKRVKMLSRVITKCMMSETDKGREMWSTAWVKSEQMFNIKQGNLNMGNWECTVHMSVEYVLWCHSAPPFSSLGVSTLWKNA